MSLKGYSRGSYINLQFIFIGKIQLRNVLKDIVWLYPGSSLMCLKLTLSSTGSASNDLYWTSASWFWYPVCLPSYTSLSKSLNSLCLTISKECIFSPGILCKRQIRATVHVAPGNHAECFGQVSVVTLPVKFSLWGSVFFCI